MENNNTSINRACDWLQSVISDSLDSHFKHEVRRSIIPFNLLEEDSVLSGFISKYKPNSEELVISNPDFYLESLLNAFRMVVTSLNLVVYEVAATVEFCQQEKPRNLFLQVKTLKNDSEFNVT